MNFSFSTFPELETERLLLRKTTFKDAQAILYIRSNQTINLYIKRDQPKNKEEAKGFITKVNNGYDYGENIYWAICLKNDLRMIGSICLWHFDYRNKKAELGYDLFSAFQHQGIMTEALQKILSFGFNDLKLTEMEAFTHFDNKRSIGLLVKNRFNLIEHESDPDNSNNVIYRIGQSVNQSLD